MGLSFKGIKLVVTDLDGTLLNNKGELSEYTKNALKKIQESEIGLILASGRDMKGLKFLGEELEIDKYKNSGYIFLNGLGIADCNRNILFEEATLKYEDARIIYEASKEFNLMCILYLKNKRYIICNEVGDQNSVFNLETFNLNRIYNFNEIALEEFSKIEKIVLLQKEKVMAHFLNSIPENIDGKYELVMMEKEWIEFNPKGINKGNALKRYAEIYNISEEEIIAFGNGENDIEMLKYAKYGIAVDNAFDNVKIEAYEICEDNEKDGVAKYLSKKLNI